jgi:hypothetical protein
MYVKGGWGAAAGIPGSEGTAQAYIILVIGPTFGGPWYASAAAFLARLTGPGGDGRRGPLLVPLVGGLRGPLCPCGVRPLFSDVW